MNGHLGGAVDGDVGGNLTAQPHYPQILHDKGIHTALGGVANQLDKLLGLLVRHQSIQSKVDCHIPDMAVLHRLGQCLGGEVFCALAGVIDTAAQINGIGTVLDGGPEGLHGPSRG